MSNMLTTSGRLPVGVSRAGHEDEEEEQGDSQESFMLDWVPEIKQIESFSTCWEGEKIRDRGGQLSMTLIREFRYFEKDRHPTCLPLHCIQKDYAEEF